MKQINTRDVVRTLADNKEGYDKYVNEIGRCRPLSREEEDQTFRLMIAGDERAFNKIIKHNLLFVVSVAKKYQSVVQKGSLTLEDLISEGNVGLAKAARRFNPDSGNKFISYAVWWIKQTILEAINDHVKSVRVPSNARNTMNLLNKLEQELESKYGRSVTTEELLEASQLEPKFDDKLKLSSRVISELRSVSNFEKRLDDRPFDDSEESYASQLAGTDRADSGLLEEERSRVVASMLVGLSSDTAEYIRLYYGLGGNQPISMVDIAERFECSAESVRQRMKMAFIKIRRIHKDKIGYFDPNYYSNQTAYRIMRQTW
jgi:RNA polymerase primary sigma factor